MLRAVMPVLCVVLLSAGGLSSQPIGGVYDLHLMYEEVEMIELVPGVEVPADQWPDDHVVTVEDLLAVGVPLGDAVRMLSHGDTAVVVPCTWGELKWCFMNNIPRDECCGEIKEEG
jgi:hypothetical protein